MPTKKPKVQSTKTKSTKKSYTTKTKGAVGKRTLKGKKTKYGEKKSFKRSTDGFGKDKLEVVHSNGKSTYSKVSKKTVKPKGKIASKSYSVSKKGDTSIFGKTATKAQYKVAKKSIKRGK